jgi:hypothetical protein
MLPLNWSMLLCCAVAMRSRTSSRLIAGLAGLLPANTIAALGNVVIQTARPIAVRRVTEHKGNGPPVRTNFLTTNIYHPEGIRLHSLSDGLDSLSANSFNRIDRFSEAGVNLNLLESWLVTLNIGIEGFAATFAAKDEVSYESDLIEDA